MNEKIVSIENGGAAPPAFVIRGKKVMMSTDLARLYQVDHKELTQAVKKSMRRFPGGFMLRLTKEEYRDSKSQNAISNPGGSPGECPCAFTAQGVAMLSSVLNSPLAIRVNIEIIRSVVRHGGGPFSHGDIELDFSELESPLEMHDEHVRAIFEVIRRLVVPAGEEKGRGLHLVT